MTSSDIKTKLLAYWRFKRQYEYVSTEAGVYNSDVLVSNSKEIIECEVKIDKYDLRNDFKKNKHYVYSKTSSKYKPNKFFFAVPTELVLEASCLVENYPYGIIEVSEENDCKIIKKASLIHVGFSQLLFKNIVYRMSSELVNLRMR